MFNIENSKYAIRAVVFLLVALGVSGFGRLESLFAPKAELWEKWTKHQSVSNPTVDHGAWDTFLKSYVSTHGDGVNRVAYGDVNKEDRQALDAYIRYMAAISVETLSRDDQLAYWINLYNTLTVKVVLTHYPVDTIRDIDISPGLFSDGPWDKKLIHIDGEAISLNDIEHRILRPIWRDPRLHYALNCASIGCPNLLKSAFTGATVSQVLEEAAYAYINDKRGVSTQDERVIISSIYAWFKDDFGSDLTGVLSHLKSYANPEVALILEEAIDIEDAYDWTLNDAARN